MADLHWAWRRGEEFWMTDKTKNQCSSQLSKFLGRGLYCRHGQKYSLSRFQSRDKIAWRITHGGLLFRRKIIVISRSDLIRNGSLSVRLKLSGHLLHGRHFEVPHVSPLGTVERDTVRGLHSSARRLSQRYVVVLRVGRRPKESSRKPISCLSPLSPPTPLVWPPVIHSTYRLHLHECGNWLATNQTDDRCSGSLLVGALWHLLYGMSEIQLYIISIVNALV